MKIRKYSHFIKRIMLTMIISFMLEAIVPILLVPNATVQAATTKKVKLNMIKKTLLVGDTVKLKVIGTSKKVTWSSNKKAVAMVSKNGKVTAKGVGTAKITAKVNSKKYTCKITVKAPLNPFLKDVPFEATEGIVGPYSFIYPASWEITSTDDFVYIIRPKVYDEIKGYSNIGITNIETGETQDDIKRYESIVEEKYEAILLEQFYESVGHEVKINNYMSFMVEYNNNKYIRVSYTVIYDEDTFVPQTSYILVANGYVTTITVSESLQDVTPILGIVKDYLLNSFTYIK